MSKHIYPLCLLLTSYIFFNNNVDAQENTKNNVDSEIIILSTNSDNKLDNNGTIKTQENEEEGEVLFVQKNVVTTKTYTIDPFMMSVQANPINYDDIEQQLKNGKNINQPLINGNTMLILGAMQHNSDKVDFALKHGANIYYQNKQGESALHWAFKMGNENIIHNLLGYNINISSLNQKDKSGKTPLHFANLKNDNIYSITTLSNQKIDINSIDINGQTAAHYAAAFYFWNNLGALIKSGCNLYIRDNNGLNVEDMILNNAPPLALLQFFLYLSPDAKNKIKVKLQRYPINFNDEQSINSYITSQMQTKIQLAPQLKIHK